MGIADKYYTDSALVRMFRGTNDKGDVVFDDEVTIPCRFDYEINEVLDAKGNKVISTASLICAVFIPPLSTVRNSLNDCFTVRSCEPVKRPSGELDHYEVML